MPPNGHNWCFYVEICMSCVGETFTQSTRYYGAVWLELIRASRIIRYDNRQQNKIPTMGAI